MQIHVSNLHKNLIEADIQRLFTRFGEVNSVRLVRDKWNNRSHGHALVGMPVQKEAVQAVVSLHRTEVEGKRIGVAEVMYDPVPSALWNASQDV